MNIEKAHALLDWLETNPERWDQEHWTSINDREPKIKEEEGHSINCGTTACVAGHGAFMYAPEGTEFRSQTIFLPFNPETGLRPHYSYRTYAEKTLELEAAEAAYLFDASRKFPEIRTFLNATEKATRDQIVKDSEI